MKYVKQVLAYIVSIFTAITLVLGALSYFKITGSVTLEDTVFKILLMSVATAVFVTIKDAFLKEKPLLDFIVGVIGCSILVLLIGYIGNWISFELVDILIVIGVTVLVYLFVWFMTVMQSKKDVEELNEQLNQRKDKKNKE